MNADDLIAYALHDVEPGRAAEIEAWAAEDHQAAKGLAFLQDVVDSVRSLSAVTPRAELVAAVRALMADWRDDGPAGVPGERVDAEVLLDSREAVALAGFRGIGEAYQIILGSRTADVDLQVLPPQSGSKHWIVLGQIEQEGAETRGTVFVWLPGADEVTCEVESDAYGVFRLELPAGKYHLSVLVGSVAVRLPPLDIG